MWRREHFVSLTNKIILLDKWFWKVIKSGPKRKIFERLDITKSCEAIENNQLKCSDYSIFFSICMDDDEQRFNWWWPKNTSKNTRKLETPLKES